MLKAQIDKSIASARETNAGVPATKTKERTQTTVQLSNKLINWTHWHVIQKYLIQANLHFFLNHFHYQRQPGVPHMNSHNLLPLILRVKVFSQRINITGPELPFCCLTWIFLLALLFPQVGVRKEEILGKPHTSEKWHPWKPPSLSWQGEEGALQC